MRLPSRASVFGLAIICLFGCANQPPTTDPTQAWRLAGRRLELRDGRPVCCGRNAVVGGDAKAAAVWILDGHDCSWCNAIEVGYWRNLSTGCRNLNVEVVEIGADSGKVHEFTDRYRFPGHLWSADSLGELGLGEWTTPLWLLVDSTSTIVLASSIRDNADPYPLQLLQIGRALDGCTNVKTTKAD